jgi:hypothetical protein
MIEHLAIHKDWETVENPGGPWTLMKRVRQDNNAVQISWMQNPKRTRLIPAPDVRYVAANMAEKLAEKVGGKVAAISTGASQFGRYGTAAFAAQNFPYCQIWSLTDEIDFITVTYICDAQPTKEEIENVREMVLSLTLVSESKPS